MKRRLLIVLTLLLTLGLFQGAIVNAQDTTTQIRVAHLSPDTPNVDVYVDGAKVIENLGFNLVTGWIELPAGSYSIAVSPTGTSVEDAAIGPATLSFGAGEWTTVAATGSLAGGTLGPTLISEDIGILQPGESFVTVFHGIEDAPNVDVILTDGTVLVSNLAFGESASLTVPEGGYDIQVVPTGATEPVVLDLTGAFLFDQVYYFLAATGTLSAPSIADIGWSLDTIEEILDLGSITDIAVSNSNLSTLVTALTEANMAGALSGGGPYTVFAPTNAAFAALPAGTLDSLLADTAALQNVLQYHIAAGVFDAEDVVSFGQLLMNNGQLALVSASDSGVTIDGAPIITTDIVASNGIIHVIGGVMIPD